MSKDFAQATSDSAIDITIDSFFPSDQIDMHLLEINYCF